MGGKRPDQYNIDPGEAGATDYKTHPQTGHGHSDLNDTVELDRQRLAQSQHEATTPKPTFRPAPSTDANRPFRDEQPRDRMSADSSGSDDDGESA